MKVDMEVLSNLSRMLLLPVAEPGFKYRNLTSELWSQLPDNCALTSNKYKLKCSLLVLCSSQHLFVNLSACFLPHHSLTVD